MYQVLIAENSSEQIDALTGIIADYPLNIAIQAAHNYSSALSLVQSMKFDLFLLNLKLADDSDSPLAGLRLGKAIRDIVSYRYTPIIFMTDMPGRAQKTMNDLYCIHYILKPYTSYDIRKCLDYILYSPLVDSPEFSFVNFWSGRICLPEISILYFCSSKNRRVHISSDKGSYETNSHTLQQLEHILHHGFFRCHRQYIINLNRITDYRRADRIIYLGEEIVPIGRSYKTKFEEIWKYL